MNWIRKNMPGVLVCLAIAVPSWMLGKQFPVVGSAVTAILLGMLLALRWNDKGGMAPGIRFTSKVILQTAVVLLGFGMNLNVVVKTGQQSLPIIVCTISTALLLAWLLQRLLKIPGKVSTLVAVGSSICGGSAIAAAAPAVQADDDEVAQAISVIFFFNVAAALLFPALGHALGFSSQNGEAFGIFAGTAINDTSSVTAAASAWDSMWQLGTQTLDKAVTVKLTRTLAIIPITLGLAILQSGKQRGRAGNGFSLRRAFPMFILYFIGASLITTAAVSLGIPATVFAPLKNLSRFFITMAMAAIGLNSNLIRLIRTGGKPILLGGICWAGITAVSLFMQHFLGIW